MAKRQRKSTRERVLTLLGRERMVYNRKAREHERRAPTMGQIAKEIGISKRQLRRWKNEGAEPRTDTRKGRARVARLDKAARVAERATVRESELDRKLHPKALRLDRKKLPVLPVGYRRRLKHYARDAGGRMRATGTEYDSSIINYNVQGWTFKEIAALVLQAWRAKKPFQFVYEVPAGGSLPKSGRSPARKVRKTTRAGTAPIDPYGLEDEAEVLNLLNRYIDIQVGPVSRRMVYVSIDDNYPRPREDDDEGEE